MSREPKTPEDIVEDIREDAGEPENKLDVWEEIQYMQAYYLWCIAWDLHQIASNADFYKDHTRYESRSKGEYYES